MSWKLQHDLPEQYATDLNSTQFSVLNTIISHVNHEVYINRGEALAWPSYARIASVLRCSVSTVKRAVKCIAELGYFTKQQMPDENGLKANNLYTLNIDKLFKKTPASLTQQEGSFCTPKYNKYNNNIININNKYLGGHSDPSPKKPTQTLTNKELQTMDRDKPQNDENDVSPVAEKLLKRINNQRIIYNMPPIANEWAWRERHHIAGVIAWLMAKGYTELQSAGILWHRASACLKFPKYDPIHLKPSTIWRRDKVEEYLFKHSHLTEFQTDDQREAIEKAQLEERKKKYEEEKAFSENPAGDVSEDQQRKNDLAYIANMRRFAGDNVHECVKALEKKYGISKPGKVA
jgi:DNA-binding MarR family transcriptional regulator